MKSTVILVGTAAAGLAGYWCEPALRPMLIQSAPAVGVPAPHAAPAPAKLLTASGLDPATLAPEQLPKHVVTRNELKFADATTGISMSVAAGSKVRLIRLESGQAVVRPGDTAYTVSVPIAETDLLEQLEANPPPPPQPATPAETVTPPPVDAGVPRASAPVTAPPATAEAQTGETAPADVAAPTPTEPATTEPAGAATPFSGGSDPFSPPPAEAAPAGQTQSTATTVPEQPLVEQPLPAGSPPPTVGGASPQDVIQVMRQSLTNGQIRSFGLAHVTAFEQGPEESVDGQIYQTGMATYRAETSLGVKSVQAKALIRDGAVVRWVGAKSGVELK